MAARRKSRLTRKEESRSIRRAVFYGCLTVALAFGLIFLGIPALIKMAIFLGSLRSSSLPIETKDTLPPSSPRLQPLPEATNSAQISIHGSAEPGSTVKIFLTGMPEKETIADNDGAFSHTNLVLTLGKNEIYAIAVDKAGNEGQQSERLTIFYDKTAPELEILEPSDGAEFFGEQNNIEIKGKTEAEAIIFINDHLIVVDKEGNFHYPLNLGEGDNQIKVIATDKAGNQAEQEIKVNYSP